MCWEYFRGEQALDEPNESNCADLVRRPSDGFQALSVRYQFEKSRFSHVLVGGRLRLQNPWTRPDWHFNKPWAICVAIMLSPTVFTLHWFFAIPLSFSSPSPAMNLSWRWQSPPTVPDRRRQSLHHFHVQKSCMLTLTPTGFNFRDLGINLIFALIIGFLWNL